MLTGLVLIACGIGLLATARPFARDCGAANAQLMPEWPAVARLTARTNLVVGRALGTAVAVTGLVMVVAALAG